MSKKITEALELHDELNQKLFNGTELKQEVKDKLLEIADTFVESLDFPINVADIRFLGSNASYNYNEHSDIDLHIISNFDLLNIDKDMLQTLYNACKNSFNNNHDITIKGIPVELYIEDMKSNNATKASYSLLNDEWVLFPEPVDYEIPDISQELQDAIDEINTTLNSTDKEEVESLINKVYLARKDGLASEGEASKGNCVFKELRNMGLIDKLRERFYDLESQELTLEKKKVEEHYVPSEYSDEDIKAKEQEYREYIATHIANVHNAYNRIVMQFVEEEYKNDLETNLDNHDKDKSQSFIFDAYRRNHLPVEEKEKDDADEDYEIAWFYHKKNNPHHWEYWLGGNDKPIEDVNGYDIKLAYYEMLCDWLSFGFRKDKTSATGESNEFETWYSESKENMIIHPEYKEWLDSIISDIIGYIKDNKKEIYNEDGLETMEKYLTNIETYGKIEKESLDVNNRKEGESKMTETKKLEEGGMSRILQLIQQGYFGTVSAELGIVRYAYFVVKDEEFVSLLDNNFNNWNNISEEEQSEIISKLNIKYADELVSYNKDATSAIKSSIRGVGCGFVPLTGEYTYSDGRKEVEQSFFVSQPKDTRTVLKDFAKFILDLGKTYYQESVVIGNSETEDTVSAALYDCETGSEICSFDNIKFDNFDDFLSKLKSGKGFALYTLNECKEYTPSKSISNIWEGMGRTSVLKGVTNHINTVATNIRESYKYSKKLLESTYTEYKTNEGFKLDYEVTASLNIDNGSVDKLKDTITSLCDNEDYLKEIFPNVGLGRVYAELISLDNKDITLRLGFSDIVDPVERGNDIHLNENEIKSQIKDLVESLVKESEFVKSIKNIDIKDIRNKITEGKDNPLNLIKECANNYDVAIIIPDTEEYKSDLKSTNLPYLYLGPEFNENACVVVNELYSNNIFADLITSLSSLYNNDIQIIKQGEFQLECLNRYKDKISNLKESNSKYRHKEYDTTREGDAQRMIDSRERNLYALKLKSKFEESDNPSDSIKLDFNVKVPLKFTQESDSGYIEDEKGNEIEMDIDMDSLYDAEVQAQNEVEEMMQDKNYLKGIFPNVKKVYVEIIALEEDELIFNIGFSNIDDESEIIEQIKDLSEGIIENIGYIDARQTYEDYTGDVDEDGDPIYDIEYSDDTVSFLYSINTNKEISITPISEKITESKKLEESNLSRIFNHYKNDPFIVISAERTPEKDETEEQAKKKNKKNTLSLKNDIRSAGFGYIPVDGSWEEDGIVSTEASFFIPKPSGIDYSDFFDWGIEMCKKYGQYAVLISNGEGNIAYYTQEGNVDMEFKGGISFNKNTIDKNIDDDGGVGGFTSLNKKNPNKNFQLQQLKIDKNIINNLAKENAKCDVLKLYADEFKTFTEEDIQTLINTLYNSKLDLSKDSGNAELNDCKLSYSKTNDGIQISLRESKDLIRYKNYSQKDYMFNKSYSNKIKIEENDTNFDILSKYKNADYGFIQDRDLEFIVETLYGKGTKLNEGINDYGDLKLEYKDGRIIDLQQK